jgi:hypothetical protein
MRTLSFRSVVILPALASILLATACTTSGGGTLASSTSSPCAAGATTQGPSTAGIFGFSATSSIDVVTGAPQFTFNGTFTDACAGVKLVSAGRLNPAPAPPEAPSAVGGCLFGMPSYTSQDPRHPGTGTLALFVCDTGNQTGAANQLVPGTGSGGGDFLELAVIDGPFAKYSISSTLQNGNIVVLP